MVKFPDLKDIHTTDSRDDKSYKAFTDSLDEIGYNSTICYNIEHGQKNFISHSNTTTDNNSLNIRLKENDTIQDVKREQNPSQRLTKV